MFGWMRRRVLLVFTCLLLASPAVAQSPVGNRADGPAAPVAPHVVVRDAEGHTTLRATRLPGALSLDGRLGEVYYRDVAAVSNFIQMEPFAGQPASEKTDVWVFFDDQNLYVSARNWESDASRRVTSDMRRDANNLFFNATVSFNLFDTPWGKGDSNLISSRVTYSLSPRMFVSALVQYQASADTVSTNARFRWEYQPGSELFVVYSDGRNTRGEGFPPLLENRSLVVKVTRLFRW